MPTPPGEIRITRSQTEKVVFRADHRVIAAAADQHAVLTTRELAGLGLDDDAVAARVRRGWLHRRHRGVYVVGHPSLTLEGEFLAAVKACGPAAGLSHFSGASHWEFVEWDGRHPEVTVPEGRVRSHPGIRIHYSRFLEPRDLRRLHGIPVTSPARTLVDLSPLLSYEALRSAVARALSLRRVSIAELAEAVDRLGPRRGAAKMRQVLAAGPAPTRSLLEDVVLRLIEEAGLPRPDVNLPMNLAARQVVPDFRWPASHLIVEADGAVWHDNKAAREADAERQALLEAHGEAVIRVTWDEAVRRRRQTIARLQRAHRARTTDNSA